MSADEIDNTKCRREELISGGDGGGPVDDAPPLPPLMTSLNRPTPPSGHKMDTTHSHVKV